MTILEDLKSGRLVVVPREASDEMIEHSARAIHDTEDMCDTVWPDHENDDGYRGDRAYVRICQWPELYRNAARYAHSAMLAASPDHTTALLSLVEGMERERDEARALLHSNGTPRFNEAMRRAEAAEARALAAEAERDEALTQLGDETRDYDGGYEAGASDMAAASDAALARALAAEAERDALREALAAEREACAAFVEAEAKHLPGGVCDMKATCRYLANEIRARALTMETNDG